ncbi:helix-turn-helix domain-containing protein [Aliikangiella maris]|uniref:Helix-turn-helix transcriptional regulator n=2 Tax=Aliikangiella maris TaxID=3162458 RepID=A0ABV3MUA2_9GAMM
MYQIRPKEASQPLALQSAVEANKEDSQNSANSSNNTADQRKTTFELTETQQTPINPTTEPTQQHASDSTNQLRHVDLEKSNNPNIESSNINNSNLAIANDNYQHPFVTRLIQEVTNNIMNADYRVNQLAESLAVSQRQLYRKCKYFLDETPANYLREKRLAYALQLIKNGESISGASRKAGYASPSYFSRSFKKKFGKRPSDINNIIVSISQNNNENN